MLWPRYFGGAIQHEGRILVLGGLQDFFGWASTQEYDPESDTWRTLGELPQSMDNQVAARVRGRVFLKDLFEVIEYTPGVQLYVHEME
jgi:hypothetical protein